jgi:hypothetical protein
MIRTYQYILSTYQVHTGSEVLNMFCMLQGWRWNSIVVYIDGSFVKHKIPVKPIYITLWVLTTAVSGKTAAWRVLGMMPSLKKSATLQQTDTWCKERRLRLHHAGLAHQVEMVNKFASEDKHVLCTDGQVRMSIYSVCTGTYMVHTSMYQYIHVCTCMFNVLRHCIGRCCVAELIWILSAWMALRWLSTAFAPRGRAARAGVRTVSWRMGIAESVITAGWQR